MKMGAQKRVWTPEERQNQSKYLHHRKIWLNSTGPRTTEGKARSAMNACKDGYEERQELKRINRYLRLHRLFLKTYSYVLKYEDRLPPHRLFLLNAQVNFFENELSKLDAEIRNGGPLKGNILAFPVSPNHKTG
jgi:hypothetical protein